jgi:acetyl esterase
VRFNNLYLTNFLPQAPRLPMHPYFQAIIDRYASAGRPYFHQVTPVEARAMLRAGIAAVPPPANLPPMASVMDTEVLGPEGGVKVRSCRPVGEVLGTCVFLHAGSWAIGDIELSEALCRVPTRTRADAGMLHGYLSAANEVPAAAEAVAEAAA